MRRGRRAGRKNRPEPTRRGLTPTWPIGALRQESSPSGIEAPLTPGIRHALRVTEDARLTRVTDLCLALPEATREYTGQHAVFRIRGRTFAYYLDDHHGDGIVAVVCKVSWGQNEALLAAEPDRFYKPAYVGPRGWVGLRLDTGRIDWGEVEDFVTDSYVLQAPRRLAARFAGD